jgi:four helix bundle protein
MNLELDRKNQFKQQFKKRCFNFSIAVLQLVKKLRADSNNWVLIDQLVRSTTSIGANIVEGSNSASRKEFINFFQIALKSAAETNYWLLLLLEINKQSTSDINSLLTNVWN